MISAVLLAWHRPDNIKRIVAQLAAVDAIGEILIWRNDPSVPLDLSSPKARIIDSPSNQICYGRFLCARQVAFPLIYVQDDDVLVHDVPELLRHFLADPARVHFNLSDWHWERRERHYYGDCHSALIGWGAIFRKEWIGVLDEVPPLRCHAKSHTGLAGAPDHRGLPLGYRASLSAARPRCVIWSDLPRSCSGDGHRTSRHRVAIAVAERLCRTPHWLDPPRMSRPRHRLR